MISVLVVASSPLDAGALHLGKELKVIRHSLDMARNREQFQIVACTATTIDDLRRYLLECNPTIVHFCGHGAGTEGLCFEDEGGATNAVDGAKLAKLFHLMNETVQCVVLNACLSDLQAKPISEHIDFVIGMKSAIGDDAAIKFAQGFYEAVWAGQAYEKAFKFGCSAVNTAGIAGEGIPIIFKSPRLGGARLDYCEATQRIENFILCFLNSDHDARRALTTQGDKLRKSDTPRRRWSSVTVANAKSIADSFQEVSTTIRSGLDAIEHIFYVKNVPEGYLLDYEASLGIWQVPLKTFTALGSEKPILIRAVAELSDYFNFGFGPDNYLSVDLHHLNEGQIYGYVERGTSVCDQVIALLDDGKRHRITVEVSAGSEKPSHALIHRVISDSWIVL